MAKVCNVEKSNRVHDMRHPRASNHQIHPAKNPSNDERGPNHPPDHVWVCGDGSNKIPPTSRQRMQIRPRSPPKGVTLQRYANHVVPTPASCNRRKRKREALVELFCSD